MLDNAGSVKVDGNFFAIGKTTLVRAVPGQALIVDEVQRLPSLLNDVHRFIEERSLRFVLLGSSARKLKRSGTNLLAGRALRRTMFPLLPEELGTDFRLDELLRFGGVPIIWRSKSARPVCSETIDGVLKTERSLSASETWSLYMVLLQAEEGFGCLKGWLGLRPNFHQLEQRVEAHICCLRLPAPAPFGLPGAGCLGASQPLGFISVLAYHLLTWIRETLTTL